jgi:hypothetical protein
MILVGPSALQQLLLLLLLPSHLEWVHAQLCHEVVLHSDLARLDGLHMQ